MTNRLVRQDRELVLTQTVKALQDVVGEDDVQRFLKLIANDATDYEIRAEASISINIFGGDVKVDILEPRVQAWQYQGKAFGVALFTGVAVGSITTDSPDELFTKTVSATIAGFGVGAGFVTITWFSKDNKILGVFTAPCAGIGLVVGTGSGRWHKM